MTSLINQGKLAPAPVCTNCTWRERIAQTAELLAWGKKTSYSTYHWDYSDTSKFKKCSNLKGAKPNPAYRKATDALKPNHGFTNMYALGADCGVFVGMVVRYSGFDRKSTFGCPTAGEYYANSKNWKKVSSAKRGDVCLKSGCHTLIYLGNNTVAEANHFGQNFGHIASGNCKGYNVWRVDP